MSKPIDPLVVKVAELRRSGLSTRDIVDRLGMSETKIQALVRTAREAGLIPKLHEKHDAMRDRIAEAWNAGGTTDQIARKIGCTRNVVAGHVARAKRIGLCERRRDEPPPRVPISPETRVMQDSAIIELWRAGKTSSEIAEELGDLTSQAVRDRLDTMRHKGIDVPKRANRNATRNMQMTVEKATRKPREPKPGRVRVPTTYDYGTGRSPGERVEPLQQRVRPVAPEHRGLTIMQLGLNDCRGMAEDGSFCGARVHDRSYCAWHFRIYYLRIKARAAA